MNYSDFYILKNVTDIQWQIPHVDFDPAWALLLHGDWRRREMLEHIRHHVLAYDGMSPMWITLDKSDATILMLRYRDLIKYNNSLKSLHEFISSPLRISQPVTQAMTVS